MPLTGGNVKMVKRTIQNFFARNRWTIERVKRELKRKRKHAKRIRIRGVIGRQRRTLERLKTNTYSLLDRYVVEKLTQYTNMEKILPLLARTKDDEKKIKELYKNALEPYPKKVKEKFKEIKDKTKISRIKGRLYVSPKIKDYVQKSERMPLIQYLQGKLRAQQFLHFGLSGLYLVRKYCLSTLRTKPHIRNRKIRKELKKNEDLKKEIENLQRRIKRDKHILFRLVKAEKEEEETTFTIKDEEEWREEEF